MHIRPARSGDVEALRELAVAAYEPYMARIGRMPAPMLADYGRAVQDGQVSVAVDDGRLVGLLVLVVRPDHLLLDNVAVRPDRQGRGVGSALLRVAEEQARVHGLQEVRLYTNEAMTENVAYYARRGYVETHRALDDGFRRVFFRKAV